MTIAAALGVSAMAADASAQVTPALQAQPRTVQAPIRAESSLVLVPVVVVRKHALHLFSPRQSQCLFSNVRAFLKLPASEPFLPKDCQRPHEIRGLTTKDFHLRQDGAEQSIESATFGPAPEIIVRDNIGLHRESGFAPAGIWEGADTRDPYHAGLGAGTFPLYLLAYRPSGPTSENCHQIAVTVDRQDAAVFYRNGYCGVNKSWWGSLDGTSLGKQMEADLDSASPLSTGVRLRLGYTLRENGKARVHVAVEYPFRDWAPGAAQIEETLKAGLASPWWAFSILGQAYTGDGTVVDRFSDLLSEMGWVSPGPQGSDPLKAWSVPTTINVVQTAPWYGPTARYETEILLPPGDYNIKVVLGSGKKFGRADASIDIPAWDHKTLALSSVFACRRFGDAHAAAVEAASVNLAPQYVPLVSKGIEFTPAGDTRFKKKSKEPLIAYFEVYEPLLATGSAQDGGIPASAGMTATGAGAIAEGSYPREGGGLPEGVAVQAHIRILDAKSGAVVKDFPPVDAREYETRGSWKIPIARKIPFEEFPKGAYRLEVQATDSTGQTTPWQSANFTVE